MKIMPFKKFLNKNNKENIAIIGHMGSGKTLFGKKIAHYFNIEHIDIIRIEFGFISEGILLKK